MTIGIVWIPNKVLLRLGNYKRYERKVLTFLNTNILSVSKPRTYDLNTPSFSAVVSRFIMSPLKTLPKNERRHLRIS